MTNNMTTTDKKGGALDESARNEAAAGASTPSDTPRKAPNPVSRRVWIALGALCVISFLVHLAFLPQLPDMVPTHWDVNGDVNGWSSREATLALNLIPLGLLLMFRVIPAIDPRGAAYERMSRFYTLFVSLFTLFMIAITWTTELTVFGILPETGSPLGIGVSMVVGFVLILLGNYLPKVKRNYSFGIKTPWAFDNDVNWRLTHRVGGVIMVVTGVLVMISGLFSKQLGNLSVAVILVGVLGGCAIMYIYSYLVFRNGNKPLRRKM
ncbi:MAG: SdpI family protein [Coriobacteriaceae bacterium]|nr:SdpI family protein [Coriobacteriaceae bacterium]